MDSSHCIKILREKLNQQNLFEDGLGSYERYITQIESNKINEPNVSFEATKSLGEAIFRHILKNDKIKGEYSDILTKGDLSTAKLFKVTCLALSDLDLLDIEIMNPGKQFFNDISEIRNSTGLISHGKDLRNFSNLKQSTIELAVGNMVNHLIVILEAYEQILDEPEVRYEEEKDFNEYLDDQNEIYGISYSKALYDQDIVAYKDLLDEYNETNE